MNEIEHISKPSSWVEINNKFEGNLSWEFKIKDFEHLENITSSKEIFSSEIVQAGEQNGKKFFWVAILRAVSVVEMYKFKCHQKQKPVDQKFTTTTRLNDHLGMFLVLQNASEILSDSEELPVKAKIKITIDEKLVRYSDGMEKLQKQHVLETEYEFSIYDPKIVFPFKLSPSTIEYLNGDGLCESESESKSEKLEPFQLQFKCKIKLHFKDQDFKCERTNCFLDHLSNINDEYSDFDIKVGKTVFKKHKLVLARCPYFRRLFATDMIESAQSSMEIEDFSPRIVSKMLEYLYTGQIIFSDDAGENLELHRIADKYEILDLKEGLQSTIDKNIQIENACQIFKYADAIGSKELKEKVFKFIVKNREAVLKTQRFKEEMKSSPDLLMELCVEFSKFK